MLKYLTLEGEVDKVQTAINRLKAFEPKEGYYVAFSGGKDSQCIYHLCEMAGVKFDAHYRITSVDPPELIRFIRKQYPNVSMEYPRDSNGNVITMWNLIPKKLLPPSMHVRYCCEYLKETGGNDRIVVTGVRWAESIRRKSNQGVVTITGRGARKYVENTTQYYKLSKEGGVILNDDNDESRRIVESCYRTRKTLVNPIVDWSDEDVWEYLNEVVNVPHCVLYDKGHKRIGCIGCPLSKHQTDELAEYPMYKEAYLRAFDRMLEERKKRGLETTTWKCGNHVMERWIAGKSEYIDHINLLDSDYTENKVQNYEE